MRALCRVAPVTVAVHERGLEIAARYGFAVYDAMIWAAALSVGCTTLYSADMQAARRSKARRFTIPSADHLKQCCKRVLKWDRPRCRKVRLFFVTVENRSTMALVRLKRKGQMTIPAEIRERLQLRDGDLLEVTAAGRTIVLVPKMVVDRAASGAGEPDDEPLVLPLKPR